MLTRGHSTENILPEAEVGSELIYMVVLAKLTVSLPFISGHIDDALIFLNSLFFVALLRSTSIDLVSCSPS